MELKITDKKENSLLHRVEIKAELTAEGATPSNKDVAKELASQLKSDEKLIVIKHIYSQFGTNISDVLAYRYETEENMKKIEILKEPEKKPEEKTAPSPAQEKKSSNESEKGLESSKTSPEA